jgi:hypothetical protein
MTVGEDEEAIETYALPAYGEGGYFLERGLAAAIARGTDTLFTLLTTTSGSTGTIAADDGTNARTLFSSPLSALRVAFAGADLVAHTNASAYSGGYAFLVSGTSGSFSRILGPLPALATLPSPSGNFVLYSYIDRGALRLELLDLETREATALPLATLVEKCAWSADELSVHCAVPKTLSGRIPDDWYQGAASFTDRIWKIDLRSRVASLSIDPSITGETEIDAVALTTDAESDVLVFMNKKDGSLWVYDL